jgi:hypothetical protein
MREVFRGIKQFLILVICAGVIAGIVSADIFGVDRHIPDASRVAEIYYVQWNNTFSYDFSRDSRSFAPYPGRHFRPNSIIISDPETIQLVNDVFTAALKSVRRRDMPMAYDLYYLDDIHPLRNNGTIFYRLRNGGIWAKKLDIHDIHFQNPRDAQDYEGAIAKLSESPGYKQAFYYPLTDMDFMRGQLDSSERFDIMFNSGDSYPNILYREISREEMMALITVMNEDINDPLRTDSYYWQYELILLFIDSDDNARHINITLNDREFTRTVNFIFDME